MGQSTPFQLTSSQTTSLGSPAFVAQSILVDNPGSYWIHFPLIGAWIPPFQFGVVIPNRLATSQILVTTSDLPLGYIADTSNTTANATGLLFQDWVPPSQGNSLRPVGFAGTQILPANTQGTITPTNVHNTATQLGKNFAGRLAIRVSSPASATQTVYIGYGTNVVASDPPAANSGVQLPPGGSLSWGIGANITLYGIVATGAQGVTVEEVV